MIDAIISISVWFRITQNKERKDRHADGRYSKREIIEFITRKLTRISNANLLVVQRIFQNRRIHRRMSIEKENRHVNNKKNASRSKKINASAQWLNLKWSINRKNKKKKAITKKRRMLKKIQGNNGTKKRRHLLMLK